MDVAVIAIYGIIIVLIISIYIVSNIEVNNCLLFSYCLLVIRLLHVVDYSLVPITALKYFPAYRQGNPNLFLFYHVDKHCKIASWQIFYQNHSLIIVYQGTK